MGVSEGDEQSRPSSTRGACHRHVVRGGIAAQVRDADRLRVDEVRVNPRTVVRDLHDEGGY